MSRIPEFRLRALVALLLAVVVALPLFAEDDDEDRFELKYGRNFTFHGGRVSIDPKELASVCAPRESWSEIDPCLFSMLLAVARPRASVLPKRFFAVSGAFVGIVTFMSTEYERCPRQFRTSGYSVRIVTPPGPSLAMI